MRVETQILKVAGSAAPEAAMQAVSSEAIEVMESEPSDENEDDREEALAGIRQILLHPLALAQRRRLSEAAGASIAGGVGRLGEPPMS